MLTSAQGLLLPELGLSLQALSYNTAEQELETPEMSVEMAIETKCTHAVK